MRRIWDDVVDTHPTQTLVLQPLRDSSKLQGDEGGNWAKGITRIWFRRG